MHPSPKKECQLWPMILTFKVHTRQDWGEQPSQITRSKVTLFKSDWPNTQTDWSGAPKWSLTSIVRIHNAEIWQSTKSCQTRQAVVWLREFWSADGQLLWFLSRLNHWGCQRLPSQPALQPSYQHLPECPSHLPDYWPAKITNLNFIKCIKKLPTQVVKSTPKLIISDVITWWSNEVQFIFI